MSADELREAVKREQAKAMHPASQKRKLIMNGSGKVIGFRSAVDRVAYFANRHTVQQIR